MSKETGLTPGQKKLADDLSALMQKAIDEEGPHFMVDFMIGSLMSASRDLGGVHMLLYIIINLEEYILQTYSQEGDGSWVEKTAENSTNYH